ncbi:MULTISPECIES: DUF3152 domain-containing protein [Thermomonosporaceae]|uniref:DUF3152 domain-containing protein n=1 Tax=Thermomonosporaceae TaxID=2012 RepID=UPI00255AAA49|nr:MULTISPECIES: DUF3152 domain-containing protein [Thermomonosporaceae]MDL4774942.1 DUF3152 domain-containing protein [Actinomadura xylanilytica]
MQPPRSRPRSRRSSSHRRAEAPPPAAPPPPRGPAPYGEPPPYEEPPFEESVYAPQPLGNLAADLDREFEGARRNRVRGAIILTVSLVLLVALGAGAMLAWGSMSGKKPLAADTPDSPATSSPSADTAPSSPPVVTPKQPPYIPAKGDGKFTRPPSATRAYGHGKLMRYMVEVEGGLRQNPTAFARSVDRIMADPRGWTAGGKWSFRRVDSGPYDFVVRLASPGTVDKICGAYGLTTEGKVNCSVGKQVVVNLKRWLLLTTFYRGQPDHYHALVINHEVGHRLGFGHMTCAGRGRAAPVMQQQIFGLKGCKINGWPFDRRGRLVTGPSVP